MPHLRALPFLARGFALALVLGLAGSTSAAPPEHAKRPPPPPPPASNTDVFGVTMLYPTKVGGEVWTLAADPLADPRFHPGDSLTRNRDGSWKMRGTQVRMEISTSTGYDPSTLDTFDRGTLAARGYMQAPNDWKNVEITGYVQLNAFSDAGENFSWYARGGSHTDERPCEGSAYKGALTYGGHARWQKESWHVSYEASPLLAVTSPLKGRWVGLKAVMRNTPVNGVPAVRLELWLNDNADRRTWAKVAEWVDAGDWGGNATSCGAAVDALPITWGGPLVTFRWDGATDVDFKWLSVRELQ